MSSSISAMAARAASAAAPVAAEPTAAMISSRARLVGRIDMKLASNALPPMPLPPVRPMVSKFGHKAGREHPDVRANLSLRVKIQGGLAPELRREPHLFQQRR